VKAEKGERVEKHLLITRFDVAHPPHALASSNPVCEGK
jgi:hypothetical protein